MFTDYEEWQSVNDRDRRELFDDVIHMLEKREKVRKMLRELCVNQIFTIINYT